MTSAERDQIRAARLQGATDEDIYALLLKLRQEDEPEPEPTREIPIAHHVK